MEFEVYTPPICYHAHTGEFAFGCGQGIYSEVMNKVKTSGAIVTFMVHHTECIVGLG